MTASHASNSSAPETGVAPFDSRSFVESHVRGPAWQVQAVAFVTSDLLAFGAAVLFSAALAGSAEGIRAASLLERSADYVGSLGTAWHGWGVILLLVVAIAQLNGRAHYSQLVPFWTAVRDVVGVGVLAIFCDLLLSTKIYRVPFGAEQALRWVIFVGLVLAFRAGTVAVLSHLGLWHFPMPVTGPERDAVALHHGREPFALASAAAEPVARPLARTGKRVFDVTAASLLLILLSPLMLAIVLLVRRDGGPALFRHQRLGAAGRSFPCIKFRSMDANADSILAALLANDPAAAAEWHATQKLRDDPRITDIGRLIRKTSLDELPQLLNVVRGEMSLVGPRPIVHSELRFYGEHAESYMQVRPGLTGPWQVSGRSDTSYERRVHLDACYVRNWTFWHDVAILAKTVPVVLLRRGAV